MKTALLTLLVMTLGLSACPQQELTPLIGEDPEVYALIGASPPDDPSSSPMAAARRLHQALTQGDSDMVWALLAAPTRRALDEHAAAISSSGRELLDASTLPGPGGVVRKVRFETIFFGRNIERLKRTTATAGARMGEQRTILAISDEQQSTELHFVLEEDGWKLLKTGF